MRRNLILGLLGSTAIHGGMVWGGSLFESHAAPPPIEEAVPVMEVMAMPPIEPDPVETVPDATDAATDISDLAPPSLADTPSAAVDAVFVQQVQPPPPPGLSKPSGTITIPTGRPATAGIGSGIGNVFDLANLDQRPEPRFQAPPKYPIALKRSGIRGSVVIQFIVDTQGNVREARAITSTHREFEVPAIEAVSRWKFRPGKKGSAAVNTRMEVPIEFKLSQE